MWKWFGGQRTRTQSCCRDERTSIIDGDHAALRGWLWLCGAPSLPPTPSSPYTLCPFIHKPFRVGRPNSVSPARKPFSQSVREHSHIAAASACRQRTVALTAQIPLTAPSPLPRLARSARPPPTRSIAHRTAPRTREYAVAELGAATARGSGAALRRPPPPLARRRAGLGPTRDTSRARREGRPRTQFPCASRPATQNPPPPRCVPRRGGRFKNSPAPRPDLVGAWRCAAESRVARGARAEAGSKTL